MINLLLMSLQSRDVLRALRRLPEEHGEVVGSGDETLDNLALDRSGFEETLFGSGDFAFLCGRNLASMIVVCGAEDKVCRERQMVHPMRVRVEGMSQSAIADIPHLDRLVVRRSIYESCPSPLHTRDRAFVAAENHVDLPLVRQPYSDRAIFRRRRYPRLSRFLGVIWLPTQTRNPLRMSLHRLAHLLSRLGIPYPYCIIHTTRRYPAIVRRPTDG